MTRYADMVPLFTQSESPHMKVQCSGCGEWISKGDRYKHILTNPRISYEDGFIIELNGYWWRKRGT
jgi:hypothetical protein